jgi:hypothetical protein
LVIGETKGKIGFQTLQCLCAQYSSLVTPVVGTSRLQKDEAVAKITELSEEYNLLVKDVDLVSSESILKSLDQVLFTISVAPSLTVSIALHSLCSQNTKTVFLVTPFGLPDGVDLTREAIKTCLESPHIKHLVILSMLCPSSIPSPSPPLTTTAEGTGPVDTPTQQTPYFGEQYQKLEKYFHESCEAAGMPHTIIRIPPISFTTEPTPFLANVMETLEREELYQSLFLSSSLKQKYPFVTLEDLGRGIARILTSTLSSSASSSSSLQSNPGKVYDLYESLSCDEEVLSLISKLWSDVVSYQPMVCPHPDCLPL